MGGLRRRAGARGPHAGRDAGGGDRALAGTHRAPAGPLAAGGGRPPARRQPPLRRHPAGRGGRAVSGHPPLRGHPARAGAVHQRRRGGAAAPPGDGPGQCGGQRGDVLGEDDTHIGRPLDSSMSSGSPGLARQDASVSPTPTSLSARSNSAVASGLVGTVARSFCTSSWKRKTASLDTLSG